MKRTILLADDSPTIQRLVTQTFADSDFTIVSVSNGEAAIRKLEEIHPDIVLADVYMPGKNGYEVCAYVRSHSQLAATPVILLAGAFDAFNQEDADSAGATAHIKKPFEPRALVSLVVSVVPASGEAKGVEATEATEPVTVEEPFLPPQAARDVLSDVVREPVQSPGHAPVPYPPTAQERVLYAGPASPRTEQTKGNDEAVDIMGLEELFKSPVADRTSSRLEITEEEIDRIAQRVIQKISKGTIESVAWDVVPDIASQVVREELKRKP